MREFEEIKKILTPFMKAEDSQKVQSLLIEINFQLFCHLQLSIKHTQNDEEKSKQLQLIAQTVISKIFQLHASNSVNDELMNFVGTFIALINNLGFYIKKLVEDRGAEYLSKKSSRTIAEKTKLHKKLIELVNEFMLGCRINIKQYKNLLFKIIANNYGIEGLNSLVSFFETKHIRNELWSQLLFDIVSSPEFTKTKKIPFSNVPGETIFDVVKFLIQKSDINKCFTLEVNKYRLKNILILKKCLEGNLEKEKSFNPDDLLRNHCLLNDDSLASLLLESKQSPSIEKVHDLYDELVGSRKIKTLEHIIKDKKFLEEFKKKNEIQVNFNGSFTSLNKFESSFLLIDKYYNESFFDYFKNLIRLYVVNECFSKERTLFLILLIKMNSFTEENKVELLQIFVEKGFDLFQNSDFILGFVDYLIRNKEYSLIEKLISNASILQYDPNILSKFYCLAMKLYPLFLVHLRKKGLLNDLKVSEEEIKTYFLFLIIPEDDDYEIVSWVIELALANQISLDLEINYPLILDAPNNDMMECGIKIDQSNQSLKLTPLAFACAVNCLEVVKRLHLAGASLNSVNGSPPALLFAAIGSKKEVIEYLLSQGEHLTIEFCSEGFSPVFDHLLLKLWDCQREPFLNSKDPFVMSNYFKSGKKEEYISKLLTFQNFQHAKIRRQTLVDLICDQLWDLELIQKLFLDQFLEFPDVTEAIAKSTIYEPFVLNMLNFIVLKLKDYKIKDSMLENIDFLLGTCVAFLYFTRTNLNERKDKEMVSLKKKVKIITLNPSSYNPSTYIKVPKQDNRKYFTIVMQLLMLIEKQQVKINWQYSCYHLSTLQWLCLSNYKEILFAALPLANLNEVEIFQLSKLSISQKCQNSVEVLLAYLDNKKLLHKSLKFAIEKDNLDICKKILSKIQNLNDKVTSNEIVKLLRYARKSQHNITDWLKENLIGQEIANVSLQDDQNLSLVTEKEFKNQFGTVARYDSNKYSYFKFFDDNKTLQYAQVENAHLEGIHTLESQLSRILNENNQDLQLVNKKIVRVNNCAKYNNAEYKIRFFGNLSDKRLLLFRSEHEEEQKSKLYISQLLAKH